MPSTRIGADPAGAGGSLSDLWASAQRRWLWILAGAALAGILGAAYALLQTPTYRATVELLIDPQAQQIVGRGLSRPDAPPQLDFASLESQALILTSTKVLDRVIAQLDLAHDPALTRGAAAGANPVTVAMEALRKRMTVRRVETSLIFQLTVAYPDPRKAAEIANTVAAVYFEVAAGDRLAAVRRANEALLTQLNDLRGQLDRTDLAAERYRADKGLIGTSENGLLVSQQLRDLYAQITAAETSLARLAARREQARQLGIADATIQATPEASVSQVMVSLRSQYAQTVQEIAQSSRSLGGSHPHMIALVAQREATAKLIAAESDRIRRTIDEELRRGEDGLKQLRLNAKQLVSSQTNSNEEGIRLRQLESEAGAIRRTYELVLSRSKDLEQQAMIDPNNSQVISRAAVPLRSSDVPAPIVVAAAALFGAVLGLAAGYLFDRWRGTFDTPEALAALGIPVWARLPVAAGASPTAADERVLAAAAGALRAGLREGERATITVVSEGLGAERLRTAQVLTELLIGLDEPAILVPGSLRRRAASRYAEGSIDPRASRPYPDPLGILGGDGPRRAVIVTERDVADGEGWQTVPDTSDAIVLVVDPGRTARGRLARLIGLLDEAGRFRQAGLIGIVAAKPSSVRPSPRRSPVHDAVVAVRAA